MSTDRTEPPPPVPPSDAALAWVVEVLGASVTGWVSLSQAAGAGPWRLTVAGPTGTRDVVLSIRSSTGPAELSRLATEAAALEACGRYDVPAPRLLGVDRDGARAGTPALLATALTGRSTIPRHATALRLREMGRVAGAIHRAGVEASPELPVRTMSLDGLGLESMELPPTSAAVITEGRAALAEHSAPSSPVGLVHGDLWQGNSLWSGDTCLAAIDWDFAGVGPAGIDLGSMRMDAALFYGAETVDEVAAGWRDATGAQPPDLAWWDVVSAVATPPDMDYWLPNLHGQGRTDLTKAQVTERRDTFLADALRRLDVS